jgi:hypothetical protein
MNVQYHSFSPTFLLKMWFKWISHGEMSNKEEIWKEIFDYKYKFLLYNKLSENYDK